MGWGWGQRAAVRLASLVSWQQPVAGAVGGEGEVLQRYDGRVGRRPTVFALALSAVRHDELECEDAVHRLRHEARAQLLVAL